jgi:hypothetical protein
MRSLSFISLGTWAPGFFVSDRSLPRREGDLVTGGRGYPEGRDVADRVADLLPAARDRADWDDAEGLFKQMVDCAESGAVVIPEELPGALADELAEIKKGYREDEATMCVHAHAIFANVESGEILDVDQYRKCYMDERFRLGPSVDNRRLPGPFEALIETSRRLRDARFLCGACEGIGTSGLLTGSTAYGPFYNVRGNLHGTTASDLDFIVVISHVSDLDSIGANLKKLPGVPDSDIDQFRRRARVFADGMDPHTVMFSHKLRLWSDGTADPLLPSAVATGDYLLSLHIVTLPVLKYLLVGSAPELSKEAAGNRRTMRDYRQEPTRRTDDDLYDFARRPHRADSRTEPAELGCVRSSHVYYIADSDCYCPGLFQTMLFPPANLLWDDLGVRPAVNAFQRKLGERIRYEAARRPHAMLRLSYAHPRLGVFAPGIIGLVNSVSSGTLSPAA